MLRFARFDFDNDNLDATKFAYRRKEVGQKSPTLCALAPFAYASTSFRLDLE